MADNIPQQPDPANEKKEASGSNNNR